MLLYRVFRHRPGARRGEPGHPTFVHRPQGQGRVDLGGVDTWYFGATPECAVGESFANLHTWGPDMFTVPSPSGDERRSMAIVEIDDDLSLLDLDDPNALQRRALRPTQIIVRNLGVTQGWARCIYEERDDRGRRRWAGISWWSFVYPAWDAIALWVEPGVKPPHRLVEVEPLDVTHRAVVAAATTLGRPIRRT